MRPLTFRTVGDSRDDRIRVGLAIASAGLRAALRLWLETEGDAVLVSCSATFDGDYMRGADSVVAEVAMPSPIARGCIQELLGAAHPRIVLVTYYADDWRTAIRSARVHVHDLSSLDAERLRASIFGTPARTVRPQLPLESRDELILELVANGRKNRDIAAALGVSQRTVQARVSRLMSAVGVDSRAALMAHRPLAAAAGSRRPDPSGDR